MKQYVSEWSTLQARTKMRVMVGNKAIMVAAIDGLPYAIIDKCPHQSYPLSTGRMNHGVIECKEHGLEIHVKTGEVVDVDKADYLKLSEYDRSVRTFEAVMEDGKVYIEL
ncbi:MAG: Rieske 2Fe-2S domain-containing protein [Candidatus Izemoplasmatales bacterium]|nr:Rieske 2Fe-2S domain-containing protein [Candidatus Izemoplasmatales bacterium]